MKETSNGVKVNEDVLRLTKLSVSSSAPSSRAISSIGMLSRKVRRCMRGLQLPPPQAQEGSQ